MGKFRRKPCDGAKCTDPAFFSPASKSAVGGDPFFKSSSVSDAPTIQKEDAPDAPRKVEQKKDPMVEGLKITGEQLFKHEPFKLWFEKMYEPQLKLLKSELWENASGGEKAILLSFAGINLGMAGLAFAQSPEFRSTLSDVNIGAGLGLVPYSPIAGGRYKLPEAGKSDLGLSLDFTTKPYLDLWKNRPAYIPDLTFAFGSTYDLGGKNGFDLNAFNLGLDFFGGGLTAKGGFFNDSTISPYPQFVPGVGGMPGSTIMQEVPGMPDLKTGPGYGAMLNLDLAKTVKFFDKKKKK